jgi:hypothetical protein
LIFTVVAIIILFFEQPFTVHSFSITGSLEDYGIPAIGHDVMEGVEVYGFYWDLRRR